MTKIVLYLGHKAEGIYNYFRSVDHPEIYRDVYKGYFVELSPHVEGWVEKIVLSEKDNTKYIYIFTDTVEEYESVLANDERWVLHHNPIEIE